MSKHIRVLERAGLVRRQVSGREHFLSVDAEPLIEASRWIEDQKAFWEGRVDALEVLLERRKQRRADGAEVGGDGEAGGGDRRRKS